MTKLPIRTPAFWAGWLSAGALLLVAAGAGVYAANLGHQLADVELRLVDAVMKLEYLQQRLAAADEAMAIRSRLELMTAPDLVELTLSGQPPAPRATGRAFVSRTHGLLLVATNLPPLPEDRTYQLWLLTRGDPVSAGFVRPDVQGIASAAFDLPADAPVPTGIAISSEPAGGVPRPSGAIYLAAQ